MHLQVAETVSCSCIVVQEKEGDEKGKKIAKCRKMFRVRVSAWMYIQVWNFHRPPGWTCQFAGLSVSGRPRIDVFSTLILVRFLVPFSCISEFQNPVKYSKLTTHTVRLRQDTACVNFVIALPTTNTLELAFKYSEVKLRIQHRPLAERFVAQIQRHLFRYRSESWSVLPEMSWRGRLRA